MNKETENQIERARAARLILKEGKAAPIGKEAIRRQKQVEMEAFMAIFHPGHVVPDTKENQ